MFEEEVANYTGSPFAVSVDSCTDALFLCCVFKKVYKVTIPRKTYLSVPQSIIHAGGQVVFDDIEWKGIYELHPYSIYDAAKRFTSGMYVSGTMMCLSFHDKKILNIGKGGMILTDNEEAFEWFKQARYEGRSEINYHKDNIVFAGWNMYMTPEQAARGLVLMRNMPVYNEDQFEEDGYKPLTEFDFFKTNFEMFK